MCTVSGVYDLGRTFPMDFWTTPKLDEFKKVIDAAQEFDKVADQPDCEDPVKMEWMKEVEERLAKLEAAAFRNAK